MADEKKTVKMDLDRTYIHAGKTYLPGEGVEVPADMAEGMKDRPAMRRQNKSTEISLDGVTDTAQPPYWAGHAEKGTRSMLMDEEGAGDLEQMLEDKGIEVTEEDDEDAKGSDAKEGAKAPAKDAEPAKSEPSKSTAKGKDDK
jgi:hypothetical protein